MSFKGIGETEAEVKYMEACDFLAKARKIDPPNEELVRRWWEEARYWRERIKGDFEQPSVAYTDRRNFYIERKSFTKWNQLLDAKEIEPEKRITWEEVLEKSGKSRRYILYDDPEEDSDGFPILTQQDEQEVKVEYICEDNFPILPGANYLADVGLELRDYSASITWLP